MEKKPVFNKNTKIHSEHIEQKTLIEWFRLQYPLFKNCLFAIPNGGKRGKFEASRLKAEGVLAGVSDLFLMIPKGKHHGLFIEMKAKGGYATDHQKKFIFNAQALGYAAEICHGFEAAKKVIQNYLAL